LRGGHPAATIREVRAANLLGVAAIVALVGVTTALAHRAPTSTEKAGITAAVLREAGPDYARKVTVVGIRVSTVSPTWALADWVGRPRYRDIVQQERFAVRRAKRGWRAYSPRFTCPIPGMPPAVKRELVIVCY